MPTVRAGGVIGKEGLEMKNIGIVWAFIASITWGLLYNFDQKILLKTSPLTMFLVGGIMQILVLIPYAFTQTGSKDIALILSDKNQLGLLFIAEMLCVVAGVAILYAVKNLTAPIASIFEISYPLFVMLFAFVIFPNTEFSFKTLLGGAFIFTGSIVLMR
jgi:drug/metabolite transporter (DMT)-like permease